MELNFPYTACKGSRRMQTYSCSPFEMVASFWRNKSLIRKLVHREVVGRYKGSFLGIFWSLITPLLMLIVYTFVFSVVFKARWNASSNSEIEFALILFPGLLVFNLFAECINRAPSLVLSNVNYVKKVIFPLEILPWVLMGSALFHFAVSLGVWLIAYIVLLGMPHWTLFISPLIIVPFVFFVMGVSWLLVSLGVYLRDVGQITGIAVQLLMFLAPIFYPASTLPEQLQNLIFLNPLTLVVENMRDVLYWGRVPDFQIWLIGAVASTAVSMLGFAWFQKTRKGFADVV